MLSLNDLITPCYVWIHLIGIQNIFSKYMLRLCLHGASSSWWEQWVQEMTQPMMRYSVSEGHRSQWNTDTEVNRSTTSKLKILKKSIKLQSMRWRLKRWRLKRRPEFMIISKNDWDVWNQEYESIWIETPCYHDSQCTAW